jgi:hypothetical protein
MKFIASQGKSYLLFPDNPVIQHKWQTVGLILVPETNNPESLNIFRVFISGNSKTKVEQFIKYQIKQGRKQEKSIQVQVEKLDASQIDTSDPIPVPVLPSIEEIKKLFLKAEEQTPDFLYSSGQITIGIDRAFMSTKPPYRIRYTIDPPFNILLQGEKYAFEFSADRPFISLESHRGKVHLHLLENRPFGDKIDFGGMDASAGETKTFPPVMRQYAGMWQAFVTGMNLDNAFTVDYSRDILG